MKHLLTILAILLVQLNGASQNSKISICLIDQGNLTNVNADYNTRTGDTTITLNGQTKKFANVYSLNGKEYAANTKWYINNEPINISGRNFVKYGLPRILSTTDIQRFENFQGVGIYSEAGTKGMPEVIYIPVRMGCEFQPYMREAEPCAKLVVSPSVKIVSAGGNVIFTANVSGSSGKINYNWSVSDGKIVGFTNRKSLAVNSKNVKEEFTATVEVSIDGTDCKVSGYASVQIKK